MPRTTGLAAAREHLSDAQLVAFFHAAAVSEIPRAARSLVRDLKAGATLDAFFREFAPNRERYSLWAELHVVRKSTRVFHITFGFHGEVGDGGEWRVVYSAGVKVLPTTRFYPKKRSGC